MKQLFGTDYQECTASQLSTAVSKPCDGITSTVALDAAQATTFLFTLEDVIGYEINSEGALEISFKDSSTLLIPNFEALADADYSIKLEDGTVIEFAALAEGGQPLTTAEIHLDFSQNDIQAIELAENRLAILLNNGEKRFVDLEAGDDTVIAFADGATISPAFLFAECKVASLFDGEDFAQVEPAAGNVEPAVVAVAPTPQPVARPVKTAALQDDGSDLADIEPAAGPAGVAGVRNTGAGFGSAISSQSIGGLDDVGPIGPTELAFSIPSTDPIEPLAITPTPVIVVAPPPPSVAAIDLCVLEDNSIQLQVNAASTSSTPVNEVLTVDIVGIPSSWTFTDLAGGTYNASTLTWTITLPAGQAFSGGPTVQPPANSDVDAGVLTASAVVQNVNTGIISAPANTDFRLDVDAVADPTNVSATGGTSVVTSSVGINVTATLNDRDGSEEISNIVISGIPAGVTLSAGTLNQDGSYSLTLAQLPGLTASSNGYVGTFTGTATVVNTDIATDIECDTRNNEEFTSANFTVTFNVDTNTPTVSVNNGIDDVCILEDGSQLIAVSAVGNGTAQETMEVTITGLPTAAGWGVDVTGITGGITAYDQNTGTVTVSLPANTNLGGGIRLTPPANSDVDAPTLTIRAVATEPSTGQTATATDSATVTVDAVADNTNLSASGGSAAVNGTIAINPSATLLDTDGSESITSITITGIPATVSLSAGTRNADGSYSLTPAQLTGLTATSNGFTGSVNGTITVNSGETTLSGAECDLTNNTATQSVNFRLQYDVTTNVPTVSVNNGVDDVCIAEDGSQLIAVSAIGNGTGAETMVVTISGLPLGGWTVDTTGLTGGGVVTASSTNPGSYSLRIELPANTDLGGGIRLTPPANSDVDAPTLTISAVATEPSTGQTASASDSATVTVDAVADGTSVTATGGSSASGGTIPLNISANLRDTDGSESITSITITGVPASVTLSAGTLNANGSYTLTPAQLTGLTATSNGFTGSFGGRVTVNSAETNISDAECDLTNNSAQDSATFNVSFSTVSTPPIVLIDDVCIPEDTTREIPLSVTGTGTNSETMVVTITGLPTATGWTIDLSGLSAPATYNAAAGTATINLPANTNLSGVLRLTPPVNSDVDSPDITVSAVATEPSSGDTSSASSTAIVDVDAIADNVNLSATGGSAQASGNVGLSIATSLRDTDGSESITGITITGIPAGVVLSAGTRNADGSYTLTQSQLSGLSASSNGYVGTFEGMVTVTSQDTPSDTDCNINNNFASNRVNFRVTFNQDATPPTVSVNNGLDDVCILEDGFGIIPVSAVGNGTNAETMVVTISGLPTAAGWGVNLGGLSTAGTYNAAAGTVTINLPANTDLSGSIRLTPPANSDVDAPTLSISAVATEPSSGQTASASDSATVTVDAVADNVNLSAAGGTATASGNVGVSVATSLRDTDGSETITSITITGVPAGVTLSAGTLNANGSYTLTPAQLSGLTASSNGYTGTFTGTITVASRDNPTDAECDTTNNTASNSANFSVTFNPDVKTPTVLVNNGLDDVCITEDGSEVIPISAVGNGSGSETMVVTITGLPTAAGWGVDLAGLTGGTVNYNAATGTATVTLPANTNLGGSIRLTPPANSDVDAPTLTATAVVTEPSTGQTAMSSDSATVTVDAVADNVNLNASGSTATVGSNAALSIATSLRDTDGSETIESITITGIPAGVVLSAGTLNANGSYTLTPAQLTGLTASSNGYVGSFNATVRVVSRENVTDAECELGNNDALQTANFSVTFNPNTQVPTVLVNNGVDDVCILEDGTQLIAVSAVGNGTNAETMVVTITGLPTAAGWGVNLSGVTGGTVNYNAATGTATVNLPANTNLGGAIRLTPPANSDVDAPTLTIRAVATEPSTGITATASDSATVTVDAVADGVNLTAAGGTAVQGQNVNVSIASSLRDTDGSETITGITITGVPAGVTLSAGTLNANGSYTLTPAQLNGLTASSNGYTGTFNASVRVNSGETNLSGAECDLTNNNAVNNASFSVTFNPNTQVPTVLVNGGLDEVCILEDGSQSIAVSAVGNGTNAETMVVTITGLPTAAGWGVNLTGITGGTPVYNAATGTVTVTLAANTNLGGAIRLTPPANSDVDAPTLTLTAVATEPSSGLTATASDSAQVTVDAVADNVNLSASGGSAAANGTIAINPSATLLDTDGSESITSITITGIPAGVVLSAGTLNANGSYTLTPAQLAGLTATSNGFAGSVNGTITVNSGETTLSGAECDLTNNNATQSVNFALTFTQPVVPPTVSVNNNIDEICILEDGVGTIPVSAIGNGSGQETMVVTISGLPTAAGWGVNLSGLSTAGTYNAAAGTVTINLPANTDLSGSIRLTPPANSDVDASTILISAVVTEPSTGQTASASDSANIVVDAVADGLSVPNNLIEVYFFNNQVVRNGGNYSVSFTTPFPYSFLDNDGSESIVSIESLSGSLTNLSLSNGILTGTLSGRGNGNTGMLPDNQNFSFRITTRDNPADQECDLTNNVIVQDFTVPFTFVNVGTPLVLDLAGDGLTFTGVEDGVNFDIDGDGDVDQTAWLTGSDNAFLALDNNGNGLIDDATELFGTDNGQYQNGFDKLASYDSNGDGKIDASDDIYADLRLWTDTNNDGISQAEELYTLADRGVASINLNSQSVFENLGGDTGYISDRSTFTTTDGETRDIVDVNFVYNDQTDVDDAINEFVVENGDGEAVTAIGDDAAQSPTHAPQQPQHAVMDDLMQAIDDTSNNG